MFVAEGAFINEFVLGFWYYLAPLKDLSFLSRSPFSLLLLSVLSPRGLGRELPSRDSRMCCSTWREFPNRVTGKVIVSFIVSFVAVLVWRHAVCISHGTDSACSGHPLRVSSRFAVAVEPPLRDGVTRPRGLRAIWREHLQCWSEMAPLDIGVALGGSGARMFFVGKYGLSAVFVSLLSLQVEVRCRRSSLRSAASRLRLQRAVRRVTKFRWYETFLSRTTRKCDVCFRKESSTPCRAVKWHRVSLVHDTSLQSNMKVRRLHPQRSRLGRRRESWT